MLTFLAAPWAAVPIKAQAIQGGGADGTGDAVQSDSASERKGMTL